MKRILVAYDGGEPAKRALETAVELARKFDATISVVSVVPFHPGRMPIDPWDDEAVHSRALEEARTLLAMQGIEAQTLEPLGDPARTIERIAREGEFDTVVIGSHAMNAIERFLLGSISEHVAAHSNATVVVAR
jgi:nucleotide-binding universal stress UspA family protein